MNQWMKIIFFIIEMAAFWCFAENFIVEEKPAHEGRSAQLRQEVMELMGDIIEQKGPSCTSACSYAGHAVCIVCVPMPVAIKNQFIAHVSMPIFQKWQTAS